MTESPDLITKYVSKGEMHRIFEENNFAAILASCKAVPVEEPRTHSQAMHEAFCCTKTSYRYIDIDGEEVALVTHYKNLDQTEARVISRLRVKNNIYELMLE